MRIFVTGASGWIGSAVIPELLSAGHEVVGLARSDAAAEKVAALGAEVRRGELDDLDGLRAAAADSEGVVHLGYNHDFSSMPDAARTDLAAITAIGEALEGTGAPLVMASGTLGLEPRARRHRGRPARPGRPPARGQRAGGARRSPSAACARSSPASRPPCTAPATTGSSPCSSASRARRASRPTSATAPTAGRPCTGSTPARLVALAVDAAPAGTVIHATAEEGVPAREIAEAIGRGLDLPVTSVAAERGRRALRLDRRLLRRRRSRRRAPRRARCSAGSRRTRP